VSTVVELNLQGVYLTKLHRRTERQQFEGSLLTGKGPTDKNQKVVHEYGLKHIIDLEGGAATGLHMDQRDNRKRVANLLIERAKSRPDSPSASLLNTFSYTCSFSLAAAKLMAEQNAVRCILHHCNLSPLLSCDCLILLQVLNTLNVDTSPVALKVGKSNFSRNELSAATHSFVRDDVFRHLSKNKDAKFDVVLLDPATTARLQTGKIWSSAKKSVLAFTPL
jgi:23S rRNA G2069 N7-methylase RlmK/C1962 C5-methylase RlmI